STMVSARARASCRSRRRSAQTAMQSRIAYGIPGQVTNEIAEAIWPAGEASVIGGGAARWSNAASGAQNWTSRVHPTKTPRMLAVIAIEEAEGGRRTIVRPSSHHRQPVRPRWPSGVSWRRGRPAGDGRRVDPDGGGDAAVNGLLGRIGPG